MIENVKLSILAGGFYTCTPAWNRDRETHRFHNTFDFWMPLSGSASVETDGGKCRVRPGHVYFVPGRHVVRWTCNGEMPMYWIATMAESFYLRHCLGGIRGVHEWPLAAVSSAEGVFRRFPEFFVEEKIDSRRERTIEDARPRENSPLSLGIKIEATLTYLVGDLIEAAETDIQRMDNPGLERLRPSIDFMDEHFLRGPQLSEIASQTGIVPHYFHRLFKKETGMTPFKYMESRRLDLAQSLLSTGRLNVKEVAQQTGYNSSDQFTRAFHRRFGLLPSRVRLGP